MATVLRWKLVEAVEAENSVISAGPGRPAELVSRSIFAGLKNEDFFELRINLMIKSEWDGINIKRKFDQNNPFFGEKKNNW